MSLNNSNAPNMIWIIIPMTHLSNKNYSLNTNTYSIANTKAKQILTEPSNLRYPVSKTIPTNSIKAKSNSSTITDYSKTQNKKQRAIRKSKIQMQAHSETKNLISQKISIPVPKSPTQIFIHVYLISPKFKNTHGSYQKLISRKRTQTNSNDSTHKF